MDESGWVSVEGTSRHRWPSFVDDPGPVYQVYGFNSNVPGLYVDASHDTLPVLCTRDEAQFWRAAAATSEFHDRYTVSRLVGAPPGYVGYDEGGQLTEKVRRRPFSVVLFDEIEKAHPDVFNTLLQILEDGRLTDGQGRIVDFKNTVIILTTNLGTRDVAKRIGFELSDDVVSTYERMRLRVNDELEQHFRPEFLNRIDDTIVFHQLTEPQILQIVDLMIARIENQLKNKDMGLELTDASKKFLARLGYDPVLGARPLRRTIQREIEDPLSEKILWGELRPGQIVVVDRDGDPADGTLVFTTTTAANRLPQSAVR